SPDRVGMDVRPLEDRIVVELGAAWQAELPPMLDQALNHELGRDALPSRPGCNQAAMERDAVEDLDLGSAADDQTLDEIEAAKFPVAAGPPPAGTRPARGGPPARRLSRPDAPPPP